MAEIQKTGGNRLLDPEFKMEVQDSIGPEAEEVKEEATFTKMESSGEEAEIRVKQEPEEEPIRTWDAQLEVFLKTIQSPCSGGETQQQPGLQVPQQITGMPKEEFVNPSKTNEDPMKTEDEDTGNENVLAADTPPTEKEEQPPLLESTEEMEQLVTSVKIEDPFLPAQGVYKNESTIWNEGNEAKFDENWELSSQSFDLIRKHEELDVEEKQYKCWNCGENFSSSSDLLAHERTHVGEKVYKCSQCGEYERTHKGQMPHRCSHCGNTFGRNTQGKTQVGEKPRTSSGCMEICSQRLDLVKHELPCKCLVCGEIFRNDSSLKAHQRLHTGKKPYICLDCGESFSRISLLISHERIHTEVCAYCGKGFSQKTELAKHEKTHEAGCTFVCFACGKVFYVSTELAAHVQTHKAKPFECSDCGKTFENSLQHAAHQKVHQVKKQHKCPHCEKSFTQRRSLNIHKKSHAGEKAHKCLMCGKNFRNSPNPKCHGRSHTGRKLYKCSSCDRTFRWRSDLALHELIHTEEKPFKCSDCGECFHRQSSLLEHSRSHTGPSPLTCSYCGKMFTSSSVLLRHQKFHVAEEACTCSQCGKAFRQQSGQAEGEALKCPECSRSHDLSSDLVCPQTHAD